MTKFAQLFVIIKDKQSKFCIDTENLYICLVLDVLHRMVMQGESKSRVLSTYPATVLLPRNMNLMHLMNPCRHPVQNWSNQALHLLCRGVGWGNYLLCYICS